MRELKFRALCEVEYNNSPSKTMIIYFTHLELDNGLWFNPDDENVYHINEWLSKPMQFTGFQDKNGIDIYEGDILSDHTETDEGLIMSKCKVFWNEPTGSWHLDLSMEQDESYSAELWLELNDFKYWISSNII